MCYLYKITISAIKLPNVKLSEKQNSKMIFLNRETAISLYILLLGLQGIVVSYCVDLLTEAKIYEHLKRT